jgi:hypothetical protein
MVTARESPGRVVQALRRVLTKQDVPYPVSPQSHRAIAQAVSRRRLVPEAVVRTRVIPCGICGGQSGTGTRFSPSSSVSPVSIIP